MSDWKSSGEAQGRGTKPLARQKSTLSGTDDWVDTYQPVKRKKALIKGLDKIFGYLFDFYYCV